jgi:ribosome-binding protein aMBF1 (putative translation factor)
LRFGKEVLVSLHTAQSTEVYQATGVNMSAVPLRQPDDVQELRKQAGRWLRRLREDQGLSQRALADLTGTEYYTFVSQLETGRGRIPPDQYLRWAEALGVEPKEFVKTLMRFYDPVTFDILFPTQ